MTKPHTRPRAWGASPEPYDPYDDASRDGDDAPRRSPAPKKASSGSFSPVTLALGLIVLVFGFWTIARRWKWVSSALELRRIASATRETAADIAELTGFPATQLADAALAPHEQLFFPMFAGGALGLIAGVTFAALGGLVLLRSRLAIRPGARVLLVGSGVFTLAHGCDLWLGYRSVALWEEQMRRMTARVGGDDRIRSAVAGAYERLVADAGPSMSDYVIDALLWVVPVLIVAFWGSRHLDSVE